jgi:2-polyprenyl-3-methyl-5-hydroxy-6-metoxy-1,4-benzoquinol methylase
MPQQSFHVAYDHELAAPFHSVSGAREALRLIFPDGMPRSVLDVGCGTGTWLSASLDEGASEVLGIDGGMLSPQQLYIPASQVRHADLNQPLKLGRLFDLVLCLETAEHLEPENAATIVETLTGHGDRILFSAAAPGQQGMHHVNCRWPVYWQQLFNDLGFACSD